VSRVRQTVELLNANAFYTLSERMNYAKGQFNPYPARYARIGGVVWEGRIYCGHNPYLFARKVENLAVRENEDGDQTLVWDEIPRPIGV
jgi:hypothetical protein